MKTITLLLIALVTALPVFGEMFNGITLASEGEFSPGHDYHGQRVTENMLRDAVRRAPHNITATWTHRSERVIGTWHNLRVARAGGEWVIKGDFRPYPKFRGTRNYKRLMSAYSAHPNTLAVSIWGFFDFNRDSLFFKRADFVRQGAITSGLFNGGNKPTRSVLPGYMNRGSGNRPVDLNPVHLIGPFGALRKYGPKL